VRFVSCFFSFFFFFSIVFTPEMHVQHYVHFGSRFFFYFFLFFFFIKNFPKCMYFRRALLTFETTHVWHMMMLTIWYISRYRNPLFLNVAQKEEETINNPIDIILVVSTVSELTDWQFTREYKDVEVPLSRTP
jgi:hypothetical protein